MSKAPFSSSSCEKAQSAPPKSSRNLFHKLPSRRAPRTPPFGAVPAMTSSANAVPPYEGPPGLAYWKNPDCNGTLPSEVVVHVGACTRVGGRGGSADLSRTRCCSASYCKMVFGALIRTNIFDPSLLVYWSTLRLSARSLPITRSRLYFTRACSSAGVSSSSGILKTAHCAGGPREACTPRPRSLVSSGTRPSRAKYLLELARILWESLLCLQPALGAATSYWKSRRRRTMHTKKRRRRQAKLPGRQVLLRESVTHRKKRRAAVVFIIICAITPCFLAVLDGHHPAGSDAHALQRARLSHGWVASSRLGRRLLRPEPTPAAKLVRQEGRAQAALHPPSTPGSRAEPRS